MRKGIRYGADVDDDWGALRSPPTAPTQSTSRQQDRHQRGGQARWTIVLVMCIVILYVVLAIFSRSINTEDHISKQKYIPNSPQSMTGAGSVVFSQYDSNSGANGEKVQDTKELKKKQGRPDCKDAWTEDQLLGRCFGLSIHSRYSELAGIEIVESPEECKALCCELDDKCMTWQYWNENKRCNLGPAVRMGNEGVDNGVDGSESWCESEPPVVWRGRRIMTRDGPKCEWGDNLPIRCHGLGAEKKGDDGNRLAKNVCERACCHTAGCTMWQQHPDRGCFIGGGENVICESYMGTFSGGRKKPNTNTLK